MTPQLCYQQLRREWGECTKCEIGERARQHVLYSGPLTSPILFVGEAPGNEEDYHGRAFVGRAGRLLRTTIIDAGFNPEHFCFTNLVACRPTGLTSPTANREPTIDEIERCRPRLLSVIGLVRPRGVVTLGRLADWHLPLSGTAIKILSLEHPSWLLRNGGPKSKHYKPYRDRLKYFLMEVVWEKKK